MTLLTFKGLCLILSSSEKYEIMGSLLAYVFVGSKFAKCLYPSAKAMGSRAQGGAFAGQNHSNQRCNLIEKYFLLGRKEINATQQIIFSFKEK